MTGGFLRPDVPPATRWHYGTLGMTCLINTIAGRYGYHDPNDSDPKPGSGTLIEEKIRDPIGARWSWKYQRFPGEQAAAHLERFNRYVMLYMTPRRDMARLGLLWLANGRWKTNQVIPEDWHRECVRVADAIKDCEPQENHVYGQGFWVNQTGQLWPNLPRDSYMAAGFANHQLWICPSLSLVVALSPGLAPQANFRATVADARLLEKIVDAVRI